MTDIKQKIEALRQMVKVYPYKEEKVGGQIAGIPHPTMIAEHEELGIKIIINSHRSQYKNKDLAITLFNLAFDELIK